MTIYFSKYFSISWALLLTFVVFIQGEHLNISIALASNNDGFIIIIRLRMFMTK